MEIDKYSNQNPNRYERQQNQATIANSLFERELKLHLSPYCKFKWKYTETLNWLYVEA